MIVALSHNHLAALVSQAAGDEGGMSAYDPTGVLKTVGFVQYLDGHQLYKFAKALKRVTAKTGAQQLDGHISTSICNTVAR
jgi:hypothetical protein